MNDQGNSAPSRITPYLWFNDLDQEKSQRAMEAKLKMQKIDLATIRQAHQG